MTTARGILLDRIAAVVDDEIILYSDLEIEKILHISAGDDKEIVWNLIDRKLLLREADKFKITEDDEDIRKTEQRLADIRDLTGEEPYQTILRVYSLTESDILEKFGEKLIADKFTDFRINFFIVIPNESISAYYKDHGDEYQGMATDDAYDQIRSKLFQEESKRRLDDYIKQLRGKAQISVNF